MNEVIVIPEEKMMPKVKNRATEEKIALGVLRVAAASPDGVATFKALRSEIPKVVNLNDADRAISETRIREPLWHQIVRNIKSHDKDEGNLIAEGYLVHVPRVGYRITEAGRRLLERKGG